MTTEELFALIYNAILYLFMITTFLGMGMSYTVQQVLEPLKRYSLMGRLILVNVVLLPLAAWLLTLVLPMEEALATGIVLVAICPAAAFGPKLAQMEKGDVPYSIGGMFLLAILSIVTIPISANLLLPGDFKLDPMVIVRTLLLFEFIPLVAGLFIKGRYPDLAEHWTPGVNQTSSICLKLVVVLMVISSLKDVIGLLGSWALLAALLLVLVSLGLGYWLGGPGKDTRRVTATTTTVRNNAVALVLAAPLDPLVSVAALVYALIAVVGGSVAAGEWAKRDKAEAAL